MMKLLHVPTVADKDWKPPAEFSQPTGWNIIKYWQKVVYDSTGRMPNVKPATQIRAADDLLASLGYVESLRALTFMGTPASKFFQYPFSLRAVRRGHEEMTNSSFNKDYAGFIGPIGLTNLTERKQRHEGKRNTNGKGRRVRRLF